MGVTGRSWMDDARVVPARAVAGGLGLEVRRGALTPCPACNADRRGSTDRRAPIGLRPDESGWRCHSCGVAGDGLRLATLALTGKPDRLTGEEWGTVRAWYASQGWCDPDARRDAGPTPRPVRRTPPKPAPETAPERLDLGDVVALWEAASPVDGEARSRGWLESRGLDPVRVAALDLARALPPGLTCPSWARFGGRSWVDGGRTLVLPCHDSQGELVGLRARWTGAKHSGERWEEVPAPDGTKAVSPRGPGALRGTLYACPVARWLLARGPDARRGDCPDSSAPGLRWDGRVLVLEGGPTWLHYASSPDRVSEADGMGWAPALVGVWAGAWPAGDAGAELAARLSGAELAVLATDDDLAGDRYATRIAAALEAVGVRVGRANKRGSDDG